MKQLVCYSFILLFAVALACCSPSSGLHSGDLIFVGLPSGAEGEGGMASAITSATGDDDVNMTHVGIIDCSGDSIWVIDATPEHGVSRRLLEVFKGEFLEDNPASVFRIVRVGADSLSCAQLEGFVENARKLVGFPYDFTFLPDNGMYYCSELVYCSFTAGAGAAGAEAAASGAGASDGVGADGGGDGAGGAAGAGGVSCGSAGTGRIFRAAPMNFKSPDGTFPEYWVSLFNSLGMEIPQGVPGTNPQDLYKACRP